MATLAQEMLETKWIPSINDVTRNHSPSIVARMSQSEKMRYAIDGGQALEIVRGALNPPTIAAGSDGLDYHAERYVFSYDSPDQVAQMIEDKMIDPSIPMDVADLPAPRVWLEWRVFSKGRSAIPIKIGVLIDSTHGDKLADEREQGSLGEPQYRTRFIGCVSTQDSEPRVLFIAYGPGFPLQSGKPLKDGTMGWALGVRWVEGSPTDLNELTVEIQNIAREAVYCLFLITTPRVCDYTEVTWGPKLQKTRLTKDRPPLVEYREVRLLIGTALSRTRAIGSNAATSDATSSAKRRLHRVVGHFRVYDRDGRKRAIWIPQHLRGDASLGISLHNRNVTGGRK